MSTAEAYRVPTELHEVPTGTRLTPEQQAVVESNIRLISVIVKPGTPNYEDAWQNGVLGLMRAAQKFDPSKGFKFSTYAMWWIRQAVQRGGALDSVHGPRNARRGDPLPLVVDLDAPIGEDVTLADALAAPDDVEADALSLARTAEIAALLRRVCKDELDEAVVDALLARSPPRRADIAERHGVTVQAIHQRQLRLIARVRHPVYRKSRTMTVTDTPTSQPSTLTCPDCGQNGFITPQAVGAHRRHAHPGAAGKPKASREPKAPKIEKPKRPTLDATTIKADLYDAQDDYDPWLVLVGTSDEDGPKVETAMVSTKVDAEQVAALLTALGHHPRRFRLADGA